MIQKYRTAGWSRQQITAIEIERETKESVYIGGRRTTKHGNCYHYFDTWELAHQWLLAGAEGKVKIYNEKLSLAKHDLETIRAMTPPA